MTEEITREKIQEVVDRWPIIETNDLLVYVYAAKEYLKTLDAAEKSRWNRMNVTGWSND